MMDPTENWKRQALAAAQIVALIDADGDQAEIADLADELATLVTALHEWISRGGSPPEQWKR